jgi:hypothetical protein
MPTVLTLLFLSLVAVRFASVVSETANAKEEVKKRPRRKEIQMMIELSFRVALETAWTVGAGVAPSLLLSPEPTKV